jgi:hypothetical protein
MTPDVIDSQDGAVLYRDGSVHLFAGDSCEKFTQLTSEQAAAVHALLEANDDSEKTSYPAWSDL